MSLASERKISTGLASLAKAEISVLEIIHSVCASRAHQLTEIILARFTEESAPFICYKVKEWNVEWKDTPILWAASKAAWYHLIGEV